MEHKQGQDPRPHRENSSGTGGEAPPPTSRKKRILALIGAILVVLLTLAYTYSLATGAFLKW